MRSMPEQKPGRSKQNYATPREFLDAVEREFGEICFDLAAHAGNNVAGSSAGIALYYGPDRGIDSLQTPWAQLQGLLWLNPPYANIAPWARKCAVESQAGARIAFLVPASVGANWFWDHVAPYARVFALSPRLSFDGKNAFPKDLILAVYDRALTPAFERWQWRSPQARAAA